MPKKLLNHKWDENSICYECGHSKHYAEYHSIKCPVQASSRPSLLPWSQKRNWAKRCLISALMHLNNYSTNEIMTKEEQEFLDESSKALYIVLRYWDNNTSKSKITWLYRHK